MGLANTPPRPKGNIMFKSFVNGFFFYLGGVVARTAILAYAKYVEKGAEA